MNGEVKKQRMHYVKLKMKTYEKQLLEIGKIQEFHTILDIGCGLGYSLDTAVEQGYEITGVEFNEVVVNEIRQRHEKNMYRFG